MIFDDGLARAAFTGGTGFFLAACLGLLFGSFATALSYRVPLGRSWWGRDHSACPHCGHRLGLRDLVPLLSWLSTGGRCRYCREAIGWRYPAIELATLCACLSVYLVYGFTLPGVIAMAAMPFLVALIAIDLEFMLLPDQLNLILGVLGIGFIAAQSFTALIGAALGAAVYGGLSFLLGWVVGKVLKKDALGLGDVKFFAAAGIWLGIGILPAFLLLGGGIGVAIGLIWRVFLKKDAFPFGPALILSFFFCLLLTPEILAFLAGEG